MRRQPSKSRQEKYEEKKENDKKVRVKVVSIRNVICLFLIPELIFIMVSQFIVKNNKNLLGGYNLNVISEVSLSNDDCSFYESLI